MRPPIREYYLVPHPARRGLFVRSIGHFDAPYGCREAVKRAAFAEFFWCIEGSAEFSLDGERVTLNRDEAWYYPVGSLHDYSPGRDGFHYWWVTLEGEGTDPLCRALGLVPGKLRPGPVPEELFRSIQEKIRSCETADRLFTLSQLFRILTLLVQPGGEPGDPVKRVRELFEAHFAEPEFNVERAASLLGLSRVVLSRTFSRDCGMTLSEFLQELRLRKALELLKESSLPVKQVARQAGFSSQEYFARVIRKAFGMTPGEVRREGIR